MVHSGKTLQGSMFNNFLICGILFLSLLSFPAYTGSLQARKQHGIKTELLCSMVPTTKKSLSYQKVLRFNANSFREPYLKTELFKALVRYNALEKTKTDFILVQAPFFPRLLNFFPRTIFPQKPDEELPYSLFG